MAFYSTDVIGVNLTQIDDSALFMLGTRTKARDSGTLGEGEFIYLKGVASTAAGDAVVFDEAHLTTRTVAASRGPIAIAMAATVANKYGWYQVAGTATVKVLASDAADVAQYLTSTDGSLDDAVVAAGAILNCVSMSAIDTPATGFAYVRIANPYACGDLDA